MKSPRRVASGSWGDSGGSRGSGVGVASRPLGVDGCDGSASCCGKFGPSGGGSASCCDKSGPSGGGSATCWGEAVAFGGGSAAFGGKAATCGGEAAACAGEAAGSGGGIGACSGRTGACRRTEGCCADAAFWGACSWVTRCCSATDCCSAEAAGFLLQPVTAKATLKKTDNRKVRVTRRSLGQLPAGATVLMRPRERSRTHESSLSAPGKLRRVAHPIEIPMLL